LDETIHSETGDCPAETTTCVHDAISEAPSFVEVLSRSNRYHLVNNRHIYQNPKEQIVVYHKAQTRLAVRRVCNKNFHTYLVPTPVIAPEVTNNAPMLSVAKPLRISPNPMREIPSSAVLLAPRNRMTLAFIRPNPEIQATVEEPTKYRVEAEERPCLTSAAWEG
jgi:hypothetical protein